MHLERFAPSPTGKLHIGHALSSLLVKSSAKQNNGKLILRIEDLDFQRCKLEYEKTIISDLKWLGIIWDYYPIRQSERLNLYFEAIKQLKQKGILFACECSRQDITNAQIFNSKSYITSNNIYPGTCKNKKITHNNVSLRLDITKALQTIDKNELFFFNKCELNSPFEKVTVHSQTLEEKFGDIIISRKDIGASYHIAGVIDDHLQKISQVTRGNDLFDLTIFHVLLQRLLGYNTPNYYHHNILCDKNGKKLSKSNKSISIQDLRAAGMTQNDIFKMIGLKPNIYDMCQPLQ